MVSNEEIINDLNFLFLKLDECIFRLRIIIIKCMRVMNM